MTVPRGSTSVARALVGAGLCSSTGLALFVLASWRAGKLGWISGGVGNAPMAPGSALVLLLLGVALALDEFWRRNRAARVLSLCLAGVSVLLIGDVCLRGFAGAGSSWVQTLVRASTIVHVNRMARMSSITAFVFLLSGLPLLIRLTRFASRGFVRVSGDIAVGLSAFVSAVLILGYASGTPLFYGQGLVPVSLLTAIAILGLDVGLLADRVSGFLTRDGRTSDSPVEPGQPVIEWKREIALSVVAVLVVLAGGIVYLRVELAAMRRTAFNELAAIGDLKAEQIAEWKAERMQDARYFEQAPTVASTLAAFLAHPDDETKQEMAGLLQPLKEVNSYANVVVFDSRCEVRLSLPADFCPDAAILQAAREALATRKIALADLHDGAVAQIVCLDFLAPVFRPDGNHDSSPIGLIAVRVNAGAELSRMIGIWPIPSETAETLLVRRDGDQVVYLSELRSRPGAALRLHFPARSPNLPAAMAVRGATGVFEGIDHRGVRVLAAVRQIPDTPWSLVAEVDQQEIYAPLRRHAGAVGLVMLALLVATGFATETFWRRRAARLLEKELDAERRCRELAERLALITRHGNDIILMADEAGRIIEANERAVEAYGYTREELLGMTQLELRAPEARGRLTEDMEQMRPTGGGLYETVHRRKDGTALSVEVSYRRVEVGGQAFGLAIIRNVTQRKREAEERQRFELQVQQTQRLESLGVMAGGIAHDFNNLLTTILGRANLMRFQLDAGSPFREDLLEIEKASSRAAELCRQMLAYAGKGRFVLETLSLSRLVEEMAHLLEVSIPKKIRFRRQLAEGIPLIEADATQLRQVVMNLVINAAEAIAKDEGAIEVSTGVMECDEAFLRRNSPIVPPAPGQYVYLEVADTGHGMDAETRVRIFDPFFTTKFVGRGLGLATVLGIVRSHHGSLKLDSEPGKGTTFRVLFPVKPEIGPVRSRADEGAEKELWRGSGMVLLADDEDPVREVAAEMLRHCGFSVLTAQDGRVAVERFRERSREIVAVVLDLAMPQMSGEAAFREIRRVRPEVPVLLASGVGDQELKRRLASEPLTGLLEKPYELRMLSEKLRELLGN